MGDRQEAFEDYRSLISHRDELLRQCAEQSERIKVLEDAATLAVDWMRAHADISGVSIYHKLKAALAEVK